MVNIAVSQPGWEQSALIHHSSRKFIPWERVAGIETGATSVVVSVSRDCVYTHVRACKRDWRAYWGRGEGGLGDNRNPFVLQTFHAIKCNNKRTKSILYFQKMHILLRGTTWRDHIITDSADNIPVVFLFLMWNRLPNISSSHLVSIRASIFDISSFSIMISCSSIQYILFTLTLHYKGSFFFFFLHKGNSRLANS